MRIRTKITVLTAVTLLTIALPAAAAKYDGRIMFGMIAVDETFGDRSSVQETYNIFNGFNVTQLRLNGVPTANHYFSLNLREINLRSRKGDFLYRIPGKFQFASRYRQHRQIFDTQGSVTSSRKDWGFDASLTPSRLVRLTANYDLDDRDGDRLSYPSDTQPSWLGVGYDFKIQRASLGVDLNHKSRGGALRYEYMDFKNKLDALTDRRGHLVSARFTTAFDFYPKWTHFLRGAYGKHELINAGTDYDLLNFQYTTAIHPIDWFKFRYNLYLNRINDSVTTFQNDNVSNNFDADFFYKYGRFFGGYSIEIKDDDWSLTDYNTWRVGGTFKYRKRASAKLFYANRSKTDKGQNTLLKDMESERIRGDLKLGIVENYLTIGGRYFNGEREFEEIGQKSKGERASGFVNLAYPGWFLLDGNYTYGLEDHTDLVGTFNTQSHNVTSRFVFNRVTGLDLIFGLSYIDISKDLDIEKSILFFEGNYVFPQGFRVELKYNVYNYDDYLIRDRYYTGNVVWLNLGYDFNFGSGVN
jgi:hypothetical protein